MTRKWSARLLALGGLAVALGCRPHPRVPPCTTPLLPGEVVPGPVHLMPGPPLPGSPPATVPPSVGAQLPKPTGVQPPPQFTKLPESTYPTTKPPLKPAETEPPAGITDLPPVLPPADVAPLLTGNPKPSDPITRPDVLPTPAPAIKPPLTEVSRPKPSEDGFVAGPQHPAGKPEPVIVVPPTGAINPAADSPPLPLKAGEKFGHAADYRWIAGVVDRHSKGGYWTIRYADIGTDDIWGGKVRLMDDERLRDFRNGDIVYVEGE